MGRSPRIAVGGVAYHVVNRANRRSTIFSDTSDYAAFQNLLFDAVGKFGTRLVAFCVMPNHWHIVLWPRADGELSRFAGWLSLTHTRRWHAFRKTAGTGHLYQGRFRSFVVASDLHFLTVCRYVEANPLRAGLARDAADWRWSSLWHRTNGSPIASDVLTDGPVTFPKGWTGLVNSRRPSPEADRIRDSTRSGRPFGPPEWVAEFSRTHGLEFPARRPGRPFGTCKNGV